MRTKRITQDEYIACLEQALCSLMPSGDDFKFDSTLIKDRMALSELYPAYGCSIQRSHRHTPGSEVAIETLVLQVGYRSPGQFWDEKL